MNAKGKPCFDIDALRQLAGAQGALRPQMQLRQAAGVN
jgi:hypothetical protein